MPKTTALLVDQGTHFDNYFATHPRCCPSRATQFTGMYSHNHGILSNNPGYGHFQYHREALPVWLQDAGYYTAHVGKYMNGYSDRFADALPVPPGWNESFSLVDDPYHLYNYALMVESPAGVKALDGTELSPPAPGAHRVSFGNDDRDYQTDVISSIAADFIDRRAGDPQPFYLALDPIAPHTEHTVPGGRNPRPARRDLGKFKNEKLPQGPSFNEKDVTDKPPAVADRPRLSKQEIKAITLRYQSRLESLLALDDLVENVYDALERSGDLDDTVIIYVSDNGFMAGEHRMGTGKIALYDESVRQPFIMRGPGIPAGESRSQLTGNIDLAPTIAALAGAKPLTEVDGMSVLPYARDDAPSTGRAIVLENGADTAVRGDRFTYIRNADGTPELYDNDADPFELDSLAGGRARAGVESRLKARLEALEACAGETCRAAAP
jgi:arylsulfatase A-like enzyme